MTLQYDADVIVVGAGLTGLRAAHELSRSGLSVLVFERGDEIGGRMSTRIVDGFKIDNGFQVLLTAYPEVRRLPGIESLNCASFSSGARIRIDGRFVDLLDPIRHPEALLKTVFSPIATIGDHLRALRITRLSRRACEERFISTDKGLRAEGFSQKFQDSFLRPFLRGVLLDPALRADYGLACFYLRMFALGDAVLPRDGIQALPNLLADKIGRSHIRLRTPVNRVSGQQVTLENGDTYAAKQVVCAVDTMSATQLGSPEQTMHHVGSCTLYFSCPKPPFAESLVVVSAEDGPIATLAVVSNVQPSYAPGQRSLIAVGVIGDFALLPPQTLEEKVRQQAKAWYGEGVAEWKLLARVSNPAALATRPRMSDGFIEREGVLYAGDYLAYPSQNGALQAGRRVAETVIERLS